MRAPVHSSEAVAGGDPSQAESPAAVATCSSARAALRLLLVGPLVVNGISLMLALLVFLRAAQSCPPSQLLWLGFSYYLAYASMSYYASRRVSPQRAALAIRGALVALGLLSLAIPRCDGFAAFLTLSALNGGAIGFYFAPLQIAMRGVKPCRTVAWTIAFYNISWGAGAAAGPFVSGWLQALGEPGAASDGLRLESWVGLLVGAGMLLHWLLDRPVLRLAQAEPAAPAAAAPGTRGGSAMPAAAALVAASSPAGAAANLPLPTGRVEPTPFVSTPALRKIGFSGAAMVTLLRTGILTTLWPALCAQESFSSGDKAWGLLLLGLPIPLLAPVWATIHSRFHRPWLSLVLLGLLAPAVGCMPWLPVAGLLGATAAVGVAVSGLVYLAVFYANTDPRWPSNSVGVTEAFIGGGGLAGPMLLGGLAGSDARAPLPYLVAAGLTLATALYVLGMARHPATSRATGGSLDSKADAATTAG